MPVTQFRQVIPVLPVREVNDAIRYYNEKLGFCLRFQDDPQNPKYAGVERDGVLLHLQWHDPVDFRENVDAVMLRFHLADVDALFAEYRDKELFHKPAALRDTPWGTREFAFYDTNGNGLTFFCNR